MISVDPFVGGCPRPSLWIGCPPTEDLAVPILSTHRGLSRFLHGAERALEEFRANARAVSETYVRIVYDRPWDPPASPAGSIPSLPRW
jgi:hypothetical protein